LGEGGFISPHIDQIEEKDDEKYEFVAVLSLLSPKTLRLSTVTPTNDQNDDELKKVSKDVVIPHRSLYIMTGFSRFHLNHEILKDHPENQKLSIICRNKS